MPINQTLSPSSQLSTHKNYIEEKKVAIKIFIVYPKL